MDFIVVQEKSYPRLMASSLLTSKRKTGTTAIRSKASSVVSNTGKVLSLFRYTGSAKDTNDYTIVTTLSDGMRSVAAQLTALADSKDPSVPVTYLQPFTASLNVAVISGSNTPGAVAVRSSADIASLNTVTFLNPLINTLIAASAAAIEEPIGVGLGAYSLQSNARTRYLGSLHFMSVANSETNPYSFDAITGHIGALVTVDVATGAISFNPHSDLIKLVALLNLTSEGSTMLNQIAEKEVKAFQTPSKDVNALLVEINWNYRVSMCGFMIFNDLKFAFVHRALSLFAYPELNEYIRVSNPTLHARLTTVTEYFKGPKAPTSSELARDIVQRVLNIGMYGVTLPNSNSRLLPCSSFDPIEVLVAACNMGMEYIHSGVDSVHEYDTFRAFAGPAGPQPIMSLRPVVIRNGDDGTVRMSEIRNTLYDGSALPAVKHEGFELEEAFRAMTCYLPTGTDLSNMQEVRTNYRFLSGQYIAFGRYGSENISALIDTQQYALQSPDLYNYDVAALQQTAINNGVAGSGLMTCNAQGELDYGLAAMSKIALNTTSLSIMNNPITDTLSQLNLVTHTAFAVSGVVGDRRLARPKTLVNVNRAGVSKEVRERIDKAIATGDYDTLAKAVIAESIAANTTLSMDALNSFLSAGTFDLKSMSEVVWVSLGVVLSDESLKLLLAARALLIGTANDYNGNTVISVPECCPELILKHADAQVTSSGVVRTVKVRTYVTDPIFIGG